MSLVCVACVVCHFALLPSFVICGYSSTIRNGKEEEEEVEEEKEEKDVIIPNTLRLHIQCPKRLHIQCPVVRNSVVCVYVCVCECVCVCVCRVMSLC